MVVPGGRVLILDLREHEEAWVKSRLGDRHLGFADETIAALLTQAGLVDVRVGVGARRTGDPFTVIVASAVKQAASAVKLGASAVKPAKTRKKLATGKS